MGTPIRPEIPLSPAEQLRRAQEPQDAGVAPAERLRQARDLTRDAEPSRAARVLRVQGQSAFPTDFVERNLEALEREVNQPTFDADRFWKESPAVAQWLAKDPAHVAATGRDIQRMGSVERYLRAIGTEVERNKITTDLVEPGLAAMFGRATPEQETAIQTLRQRQANLPDLGPEGFLAGIPVATIGQLPVTLSLYKGAATGLGVGAAVGGAVGAMRGAVAGPGGAATGAMTGAARGAFLGSRVGVAVEGMKLETAMAFLDYRELPNVDRETAAVGAMVAGIVSGALELVPFEAAAKTIPGLRRLGKDGVREMLMAPTTRGLLQKYAGHILVNMTAEGVTEGAQAMVTHVGKVLTQRAGDGTLSQLSPATLLRELFGDAEAWQGILAEARAGAQAGGGFGVVTSSVSTAVDFRAVRRAEQNASRMQAAAEAIHGNDRETAMTIAKDAPQAMQDAVASVGSDGAYFDINEFTAYWQSQTTPDGEAANPREVALALGVTASEYDAALETQGTIHVLAERLLVDGMGSAMHRQWFVDNLRSTPTELSRAEAARRVAEMDAEMQSAPEVPSRLVETDAAVETLRERVTTELRGARAQASEVEAAVSLWTESLRTAIERNPNIAVADVARRFERIQIVAKPVAALPDGRVVSAYEVTNETMDRGDGVQVPVLRSTRSARAQAARMQERLATKYGNDVARMPEKERAQYEAAIATAADAETLNKSLTPVDYAALRGPVGVTPSATVEANADALEQAAFHGTPYTFDKFSLSAIGTGEGAQAFGWGLYFAESQDVAEGYQRTLSDQTILVDGEEVVGLRDNQRHALGRIALIGYEAALREATDTLQTFEREFGTEETMLLRDVRERLSAIQSYAGRDVRFRNPGSLYRVDLPDEAVARMLDWDKVVSPEQAVAMRGLMREATVVPDSEGNYHIVRSGADASDAALLQRSGYADESFATAALTRNRTEGFFENLNGESAYKFLVDAFGNQREASLALLAAGIPGIKYLDAGSRVPLRMRLVTENGGFTPLTSEQISALPTEKERDKAEILRAIAKAGDGTLSYQSVRWSNASKLGEQLGYIERIGKNSTKGWTITDAGKAAVAGKTYKFLNLTNNTESPAFATMDEAQAWRRSEEEASLQTRNLVVFDENLVTITHRNGEPVTAQERVDFLAQEAMGSAVSTRFPTAMKATEDPLRSLLSIGLAEMQMDPKAFAKNVAAVAQYPNMRVVENETPEQTAERFIQHVSDNLLWLHDQVDEATRQRSKLWYDGARRIAERWSGEYGLTVEQVSGVMAALSPQKDWYQNVSLARRVLDTMSKQAKFRWTPEMTETAARLNAEGKPLLDPEYVALIKGKVLGQLQDAREIAWFVRVYDETYNDRQFPTITPEGGEAGPVLTAKGQNAKVAWGSYNEIAKAVAMALEPSLANISMNLGGAHKVRNFYNNIVDPNSPRGEVTIDTHAVAAGLLRPLSGKSIEVKHNLQGGLGASNSSIFGVVGTYGLFAEAYRRAAVARNVLPREMQSITWEAIRGLFPAEFKDAKNVEAVDAVWQQYRDGTLTLDAVRTDVARLAGGIENPTWYGSDAGLDAGLESPADARGVSEGVGAVGAARPRVRGDVATAVSGQRSGISGGFARARENVRAGLGPNILFQQAGEFAGAALPETLEVDGVSRPTRNSTGQPIHPTEEGIRNFWRWATEDGREPIVDANGLPMVLYHGTRADFDEFIPGGLKPEMSGRFIFAQSDPTEIQAAHNIGGEGWWKEGARVLPLYARAKRVLEINTADEKQAAKDKYGSIFPMLTLDEGVEQFKADGFDAFINNVPTLPNAPSEFGFVNPNDVKSALANSGEFGPTANILRQGARAEPRGAFIAPAGRVDGPRLIALFEKKNLTTFLHESAHAFLDLWTDLANDPNAAPEFRELVVGLRGELGATGNERLTVAQEEAFAGMFLDHVKTGRAPSLALRQAFASFASFISKLWSFVKGEIVPASAEVTDFLNRLLATDEAIEAARGEFMAPLFPEDASINEAFVKARTFAEERTRAEAMRTIVRAEQEWWKRESKRVEEEVRERVSQDPAYIARQAFTALQNPDGTPLPADSPFRSKLNKAQVVGILGEDGTKALPRGKAGAVYATTGEGMDVGAAAQVLGYESASALLNAIRTTQPIEAHIQEVTDATMRERYGDPMTDGTIPEVAIEAVHNDALDQMRKLEIETIIRNHPTQFRDAAVRAASRPLNLRDLKSWAESHIAQIPLKALRPQQYESAERKATKDAVRAVAEGRWADAVQAKARQRMSAALYAEAIATQDRMAKAQKLFGKVLGNDERIAARRNFDIVQAARQILASVGVGRKAQDTAFYLQQLAEYDPATAETLQGVVAELNVPPRDSLRNLSVEEFDALVSAVEFLWFMSLEVNTLTIAGERISKQEVLAKLMDRLRDMKDSAVEGAGRERAASWTDKANAKLLTVRAAGRRVESWVDFMDKGDIAGAFRNALFQEVRDQTANKAKAQAQDLERYEALVSAVRPHLAFNEIAAPELGRGRWVFKDTAHLLGALLHTGNPSNFQMFLDGRGWTKDQWFAFRDRMVAEGKLVPAHIEFVQGVWNLFEDKKPEAQKVYRRMFGKYFAEITREGFTITFPDGTTRAYAGGYTPATKDPDASTAAAKRSADAMLEEAYGMRFPTVQRGFTISRVQNAEPLLLSLDIVKKHLDATNKFIYLAEPVRQVGRLLRDREFRAEMDRVNPSVVNELLMPWLERSSTQVVERPSGTSSLARMGDGVAKYLRTTAGAGFMFLNVANTLEQATGLSVAAVRVQPKYLALAEANYMKDADGVRGIIDDASPFMNTRNTTQVGEVVRRIDVLTTNPNVFQKVQAFAQEHAYVLQSAAQNHVDTIVWYGSYMESLDAGLTESDAIKKADADVRLTQGSFDAVDISAMESGTPWFRLVAMFAGYFNMLANLNATEMAKAVEQMGVKRSLPRLFTVYGLGFAVPMLASNLIRRGMMGRAAFGDFDGDDEWGYLDDWFGWFFGQQAKGLTAMAPPAGSAVNFLVAQFDDKPFNDQLSVSPALSFVESAGRGVKASYDLLTGEEFQRRDVRDMLALFALMTRIPVTGFARPLTYLYDVEQGTAQPSGTIDFTRGLLSGQSGTTPP